jgi:very-short-patch-repair endonuclease
MLDFIVDFYCHEIGLVIEVDGSVHPPNFLEDAHRQGRLEAYGVQFLRFSNEEIFENKNNVLDRIRELINESIS